ncbi:MAG: LytTR family DNA-binding domain-containing protein [Clostridium sp.]|nr:LytTR family DNA-binding domain-containing protein [Clostridium sp.]
MTVQIALCDDEAAELEKTENLLSAYEQKHPDLDFVLQRFERSDGLLTMVKESNYVPDVVFMDIYMPGERGESAPLGMEAAKQLRDLGSEAKLIFLTTSREYALEAFDVEASCYLVKPLSEDKLFPKLDRFLEETERERRKCILLRNDGRIVKVSLSDMVYCEAQGKRQCICMEDGTELFQNLTMTKIWDMCAVSRQFVRVGASYIINLEHIDSMNAEEVQLDNGKRIYLPRGTYRCLREQYFEYYCSGE